MSKIGFFKKVNPTLDVPVDTKLSRLSTPSVSKLESNVSSRISKFVFVEFFIRAIWRHVNIRAKSIRDFSPSENEVYEKSSNLADVSAEKIKALNKLKEDGLITEEEYIEKRKKL